MRHLQLLLILLACSSTGLAQKVNWKTSLKKGEKAQKMGKFMEAAEAYELAYNEKPEKEKIAYLAGYAYFRARDYKKALSLLKKLKRENVDYPLAGFFYAKSLKALGDFTKAAQAFRIFRRKYPGFETDEVLEMAKTEIQGCDLALELEGMPVLDEAKALPLNTVAQEFAPIPFSDDILYFSSNEGGRVHLLRTQYAGGQWSTPIKPDLPKGPDGHYGQGAFSPDQKAFYFTICSDDQPWDSRDATCEIYGTMRAGNSWSTPEKLRDYLKGDGTTATHPFVFHSQGKEFMLFVSDQSGGQGGLDIWMTSREIDSPSFDFTFPANLGNSVNSRGEEVTPFFDQDNQKLFFSSNGFGNLGGFDIFVANGKIGAFHAPENLGYPYNSRSDDYYYRKAPNSSIQFFTSNRPTLDWETTTDDNIFQVGDNANPLAQLSGIVKDRDTDLNIEGAQVMILEKRADGKEILLTTQSTEDGAFKMPLMVGRDYKIEASAAEYQKNAVELAAGDIQSDQSLIKNIYLNSAAPVYAEAPAVGPTTTATTTTATVAETDPKPETFSSPEPDYTSIPSTSRPTPKENTPTTRSTITSYSPSTDIETASESYTTGRFGDDGVRTTAPKHQGSYYKIQISILDNYQEGSSEFDDLEGLGRIDTEFIISKGWTRVLVADFFDKDEALRVLYEVRQRGYLEAFLVRYQNGYRKI